MRQEGGLDGVAVIMTKPYAFRDIRVESESDCLGAMAEYPNTLWNPTIWTRSVNIDIADLAYTWSVYLICI